MSRRRLADGRDVSAVAEAFRDTGLTLAFVCVPVWLGLLTLFVGIRMVPLADPVAIAVEVGAPSLWIGLGASGAAAMLVAAAASWLVGAFLGRLAR